MYDDYVLAMILAAFFGTYLTRILPFWLFKNTQHSDTLMFIQKNTPLFIMIVLFFYTFYSVDFSKSPYGLDNFLACIVVFFVHFYFKNVLLSIVFGTIFYMVLLQTGIITFLLQ